MYYTVTALFLSSKMTHYQPRKMMLIFMSSSFFGTIKAKHLKLALTVIPFGTQLVVFSGVLGGRIPGHGEWMGAENHPSLRRQPGVGSHLRPEACRPYRQQVTCFCGVA